MTACDNPACPDPSWPDGKCMNCDHEGKKLVKTIPCEDCGKPVERLCWWGEFCRDPSCEGHGGVCLDGCE